MTEARDSDDPYQPIACDLYSEFEVAILRRRRLRLRWVEGNVIHEQTVMPLDLQTRAHAEFLICRAGDGQAFAIRLDRIRHSEAV